MRAGSIETRAKKLNFTSVFTPAHSFALSGRLDLVPSLPTDKISPKITSGPKLAWPVHIRWQPLAAQHDLNDPDAVHHQPMRG
jgi:hypothetical protein